MMKKLWLILCIILCMAGLTACGTDPEDTDYNGYTYDQLKAESDGILQSLEMLDDETKQQIETQGTEMIINLVKAYDELKKDSGAFVKNGDFTVTKSGETLTTTLNIEYENDTAVLTFVYKYHNMEVEDITVERIQSTGEKMSRAVLNCLMGMGTVFAMLIIISGIISGFKVIPYLENKWKAKNQPEVQAVTPKPAAIPAPSVEVVPEVEAMDDLELTAVIAAAIAAGTGQSTDDFVVRSIKRR